MPLAYADLLKFAAIVVVPVLIVMVAMLWRLYRAQNPKEFDWERNRRQASSRGSRDVGKTKERRRFHAD